MSEEKNEKYSHEDVLIVAERIKLLWGFLAELIPHKEMLKEAAEKAGDRSSMVLSAAPLIGAFGQDYEEIHMYREVERKRAVALYNLVNVLIETEEDFKEFFQSQHDKRAGLEQLRGVLGF